MDVNRAPASISISKPWHVLGPFKTEATWGADPLEVLGGFRNISYTNDPAARFSSALGINGSVGWSILEATEPKPDDSTSTSAKLVLDVGFPDQCYRGCVYGWTVGIWIDGEPFFGGDFYAYRRAPVTLKLAPGSHVVDLRLVRDVRALGGVGEPRIQAAVAVQLVQPSLAGDGTDGADDDEVVLGLNLDAGSVLVAEAAEGKLASPLASVIGVAWEGLGLVLENWLVSGHSNGGQGSWFFLTHQPDKVIAAAPVSGYSSIENYVPFTMWYDGQAAIASVIQTARQSFKHEFLMGNFNGIPIFQQHGSVEDNVPVYHSRLLHQLIWENGWHSENHELLGKEHCPSCRRGRLNMDDIGQRYGRQNGAMDAILRSTGKFTIRICSRYSGGDEQLMNVALQISRNLLRHSNSNDHIIEDEEEELRGPGNLITIAIGNSPPPPPGPLLTTFPIHIANDHLMIRTTASILHTTTPTPKSYSFEPNLGAIFLLPRPLPHQRLEVVVWGADWGGLWQASRLLPLLAGLDSLIL
ncbi:hypothetical protein ACJ73_06304 [Blastomyces percursus]|uniref:Peptidase S9 prolyl oligopeptidase catalytic domain-containing protein n=1 Tax=Blastomyces percursus TaxID=1658174 RepID=A0A1J9R2V2_9EURO|nr:hypothetical protein ACJ73_06304 [Blastomyces percursus]